MKPTSIILVFILLSVVMISCHDAGDPVSPTTPPGGPVYPPTQRYVPGRVVVGFGDTVNAQFIQSFVDQLHLSALSVSADSSFSFWIQVDSGDASKQLTKLLQDSAVAWAELRGYGGGDPSKSYILAHFNGSVPIEQGLSFVRSIPGLSWMSTLIPPRSALLQVEVGQEQSWVDVLKTYSVVRYAELVFVITISN